MQADALVDVSTDNPAKPTPLGVDDSEQYDLTRKGPFAMLYERTRTRFEATNARTRDNRLIRRSTVDVKGLQQRGVLAADETIIPVRVVDENVTRELPKHLAFLKQSRRLAIFEPQDLRQRNSPTFNVGPLESEFTRVMQYDDWELDYVRWLDGAAAHGWSWARVRYAPDNPGAVAIEHVRQDYLLFDTTIQCIQHSPMVVQLHLANIVILRDYQKRFSFDAAASLKLEQYLRAQSNANDTESANYARTPCYFSEVFFKQDDIVYVAWWSKDISDFLKAPEPFYNGVQEQISAMPAPDPFNPLAVREPITQWVDSAEREYPFVPMYAEVTEDATIIEHRGAAVKDYYMQEAATTILSALVVATQRAANYMIVPDKSADVGIAPKQLNLKIENGKVWNQSVKFISTPFPDSSMFKVLDTLYTRNAEANADIAWAVNNRQDSRKTAAEVQAAQAQTSQLNSTAVLYFSMALREVYTRAWRIVQNNALRGSENGGIDFLLTADGVNDVATIGASYRLRTAGDVDYVARQERINAMRQDWPVMQTTGAAMAFLSDYIKLMYPDAADTYIAAISASLQQSSAAAQLVQQLGSALQAAVTGPDGALRPEFAADGATLQQLQTQTQQFLANVNSLAPASGGVSGATAGQPAGPAAGSPNPSASSMASV